MRDAPSATDVRRASLGQCATAKGRPLPNARQPPL